ncbi:MAG: hypothetical protein V3V29_09810 [Acidimicrobiia bacterium]
MSTLTVRAAGTPAEAIEFVYGHPVGDPASRAGRCPLILPRRAGKAG